MEAKDIHLKTLLAAFFAVLLLEAVSATIVFTKAWSLPAIGALRILEIAVLAGIVILFEGNLRGIGICPDTAVAGIKRGALWSIVFGIIAGGFALGLLAFGIHPLHLLKTRLPDRFQDIFAFFIVGGIIAPVAEEIFFRGVIFTYFRRFGVIFALIFSTVIFATLHTGASGIPLTQIAGGVLFAAAFEVEKNLFVPTVIHILGNLTIFSISFISS